MARKSVDEVEPVEEITEEVSAGQQGPRPTSKIKFAASMPVEEAVAYFEAVVDSLKKGSLRIRQGDCEVVLAPQPRVDVKVKAASKGGDESVQFEISWSTVVDADLAISSS
jgi:amphi-Trp domain-containing protein